MRRVFLKPTRAVRLAAALSVALLGACDGDGEAPPITRTTANPATTTSSADPREQAALEGYRGYWDAYLEAADPMDPEHPLLGQHATGPALETVQKAFVALKSAGKVIRGDLDLAPRVVAVEGETATVRDCYGDNTGVYDATTGKREDEPSGKRHLVTATLRLTDGTWKVERLADEGLGCTAA